MSSTLATASEGTISPAQASSDDAQGRGVGGETRVAEVVVAKLAQRAALSVDEVVDLDRGAAGAVSGVMGRVRGGDHAIQGVAVEVGRSQAAVDLTVAVVYPSPIREVANAVRRAVMDEVGRIGGLEVVEVNVEVIDLPVEGDEERGARRRRVR